MTAFRKHTGEKVITVRRVLLAGAMFLMAAGAVAILSGGSHAGWGTRTAQKASTTHSRISAAIEPETVALGEAAILVVQVSGEDAGPPQLSAVDGLRFYSMGRSSQYQSINGRVFATTSYLFQVQAEHQGDFVIPPVAAEINGTLQKSEPVTLRVAKGIAPRSSGNAPPSYSRPSHRNAPSGNSGTVQRGELMSWEEGKPAFLRVLPRKGKAYVGELLPLEIKAYFRQGVRATLRTLPTIEGGAFAFSDLGNKPEQTEEVMDGVPYNVLTWYTAVSAVKEGDHPVTVELDATLGIPERSRRPSPFGRSLFDDDFFNGFFQNVREEPVKLANPRLKIRVLPLPKTGQPKNFNGAVGHFSLSASATPRKAVVGDPITVKMRITGSGNFDRVGTPVLDVGKEWKTYRPSASFDPSDTAGYTGEKSFEEAVIPMDSSISCVPPVTFSYFDTDKEAYVTLRTKEIPLTLAPAENQPRVSAKATSPADAPGEPAQKTGTHNNGLAPLHVAMGTGVRSLRPIVENPWFLGAQGFPMGVLFMGLFFGHRRKRRLNDPGIIQKKQVKQKVNQSIKRMDRAIKGHDTAAFFDACRAASQERLGEIWGQKPESITSAEIKNRLGDKAEGMATVFEKADAAAYSGQRFGPEELRKLRDLVVCELDNLEHGLKHGAPPSYH